MKLLWFIEYLRQHKNSSLHLLIIDFNKRRQQVNKYSLYWQCSLYVT